nr:acetoacetyl-CoA synthetase [Parasteatoda tepidariorum]
MVDEYRITHIFIATSIIEELIKRNHMPSERHSLKSLKAFYLGGSIVKPYTYDYMYDRFKGKFLFSSGFGSTETVGSCFLSDMTLPLHRGEISAITLGYNYECLNDEGKHVLGEIGELAIVSPLPNLPLGLINDQDGTKYREKYFHKYPGKFLIGDKGIINPKTKGVTLCGRSDETLKQRGCRFGSSEIYNIVEQFSEVRDSLCVSHYNQQMDERAVLFLKMKEDHQFSKDLTNRIRVAITKELTARHVPDVIIEAQDIPYNVNGKKMELLVKSIINNKSYITDFVSNPDSLKYYINRKELCTN